ncbi:MAG TPA: glycosyltransferase family 2 protein [Thiotrichales bacterium]|nr:glycosyltransferase family 2 protein [Thiotrichales bacterium]
MVAKGLSCSDLAVVIVTHHPDPGLLRTTVTGLVESVGRLVVVDNGSGAVLDSLFESLRGSGAQVVRLGRNRGIGAAQNVGMAEVADYPYTLFLDQDSHPDPGVVIRLREAMATLEAAGERVAAVGPVLVDTDTGLERHFLRIRGPWLSRRRCSGEERWIETDFLIASGCLVSRQAWKAVGVFDESLFIDNVDLDWSFRARARGYRLVGVCGARMPHRVGHTARRLPGKAGTQLHVHKPRRQYYITRNRILLWRRPHAPAGWIWHDLWRALIRVPLFLFYVRPAWPHLYWTWRGLLDGLRGRTGPLPEEES